MHPPFKAHFADWTLVRSLFRVTGLVTLQIPAPLEALATLLALEGSLLGMCLFMCLKLAHDGKTPVAVSALERLLAQMSSLDVTLKSTRRLTDAPTRVAGKLADRLRAQPNVLDSLEGVFILLLLFLFLLFLVRITIPLLCLSLQYLVEDILVDAYYLRPIRFPARTGLGDVRKYGGWIISRFFSGCHLFIDGRLLRLTCLCS